MRTGSWSRAWPVRAAREVLQQAGRPLLAAELTLEVYGTEQLDGLDGPFVVVANHASHLDAVVLLSSLPGRLRRRTALAAPVDRFADSWWRLTGALVVFTTVPVDRADWSLAGEPARLLADGWNLIVFPEGSRSPDGFPGTFRLEAADLAVARGIPVVPVGIRGAYAAMPRGRGWPTRGRPRVSVRWGEPVRAATTETAAAFNDRVAAAVEDLVHEDEATWWQARRLESSSVDRTEPGPPEGSWRRIWEQSDPPVAGNRARRAAIWRR